MSALAKRIRKAVGQHGQEMAALLKDLVAVPTENPPGKNYRACAQALARKIKGLDLDGEVRKIQSPRASREVAEEPRYWVAGSFGHGQPSLYFHGHFDVVPASAPGQFTPRIRNGNLFGRGATDMKGGLVAMIFAARALKDLRVPLRGRVQLVFVPDEETGGARGTAALFRSRAIDREAIGMLTAEPTGGAIWNASRGAISIRVTVRGKAAHVGLSARGVNAFEKMLEVARALEVEKRRVARHRTHLRISPASARRSILLLGGRCEGGANFNAVPAECSFTLDRRTNPEEDLAAEKKALSRIFDRLRHRGIELHLETLQEGRGASVAESHPLTHALARSASEITGRQPRVEMCPGLLETRFYAERGIPALAFGPGRLEVAHGPNEFVSLRKVEECAAVYALTAARLLGE